MSLGENNLLAKIGIDATVFLAAAPPEKKAEAKGWLEKALSHPFITSILGGLSGGLVG